MSTTSTLAAAQTALSDLLANRKPTSSKRRKASKKSATSATTVSAAKQTVDLEAAARRLANQGKIGNKEKDARERILEMREVKRGPTKKSGKKRKQEVLEEDSDSDF